MGSRAWGLPRPPPQNARQRPFYSGPAALRYATMPSRCGGPKPLVRVAILTQVHLKVEGLVRLLMVMVAISAFFVTAAPPWEARGRIARSQHTDPPQVGLCRTPRRAGRIRCRGVE
jgi:hypothetical protein